MTTKELHNAGLGQGYWQAYVRLNGYAWEPTDKGLQNLSRNLDLNITHLRQCINLYLES